MNRVAETERDVKHAHLFCGIGGGAMGFNRGSARVGTMRARSICLGGIDVDPASCRDFESNVGVKASCLDLFTLEQYESFHGKMPPAGWKQAVPWDIVRSFQGQRPNVAFLSAPCKGFSGLLSEKSSKTVKYQALNGLTLRGIRLLLEAYADDPIELLVFENVPRIMTRGRFLLDEIIAMLRAFGYAVAESTHDCGELGGLGQSRKRFLLVARHEAKVPAFLYEPAKHRLLGVGEVLGRLPLPLSGEGGPMHRMPSLQWKTWARLAFVRAGADWRSLNELAVADGYLRDYGIVPDAGWHRGVYGITPWDEHARPVTGSQQVASGAGAVADPRFDGRARSTTYGVKGWQDPANVVAGESYPTNGAFSVADPRPAGWVGGRDEYEGAGNYGVVDWRGPSRAVVGHGSHDNGFGSVADPRPEMGRDGKNSSTEGASENNGFTPGADDSRDGLGFSPPRPLPGPADRLVCVIIALDGTWHRPFTTLELAALQGFVCPEEKFELDGLSDSSWRERIGNAVPPPSAQAIADVMFETLLLSWTGTTFTLSNTPIWVRDVAVALSVRPQEMPSW